MQRRIVVCLLSALLLGLSGCGDSGSPEAVAGGSTTTRPGGVSAFCDAWNAALASGDDAKFNELLSEVPAELKADAQIVRDANAAGGDTSATAEAAVSKILGWTELYCERGEPGAGKRRVAPPIDTAFAGLVFCGTTAFPSVPRTQSAGMVLYGDGGADDPYDGPMLGLLWNPVDDGTHVGDGDSRPVTVRGQSGVAAPITVFQQTILPELGTVIAWTEGDRAFGLYGRRWPIERAGELVEIADKIADPSGQPEIAADALPDDFTKVASVDPRVTSLIIVNPSTYSLRFQGRDGLLSVHGLQMSESEFEAFRFFTIGVARTEIGGHKAFAGNAWNADGPAVVTWREPDGLVVRIVGIDVSLAKAKEVAERSRELSPEEWAALVTSDKKCPGR